MATEGRLLLKGLLPGGVSHHRSDFVYDLPRWDAAARAWRPGAWTDPAAGDLAAGAGYHVADNAVILNFVFPGLYEAEARGEVYENPNDNRAAHRLVARQIRLLRPFVVWHAVNARLLALDAARAGLDRCGVADRECYGALEQARRAMTLAGWPMFWQIAHRRAEHAAVRMRQTGQPVWACHAALAVYYATIPGAWPNVLDALWLSASCDPSTTEADALQVGVVEAVVGWPEALWLSRAARQAQYQSLLELLARDPGRVAEVSENVR